MEDERYIHLQEEFDELYKKVISGRFDCTDLNELLELHLIIETEFANR